MPLYRVSVQTLTDIHQYMRVHRHHINRHHTHIFHTSPGHTHITCVHVLSVRGELFLDCNLLSALPLPQQTQAPLSPTLRQRRAEAEQAAASSSPLRHLLQQVLLLVEVLKERGLADELVLLAHLLARLPRLGQLHLQGAQGRPHHLAMAEVLEQQRSRHQRGDCGHSGAAPAQQPTTGAMLRKGEKEDASLGQVVTSLNTSFQAEDVAPLEEWLSRMYEALGSTPPALDKPGVAIHSSNPCSWEAKAGGSEVQCHL